MEKTTSREKKSQLNFIGRNLVRDEIWEEGFPVACLA